MLLSSRQMPPRMILRRNPPSFSSSNAASPSYSQFNFSRLLESPPASPGLPPIAPRRRSCSIQSLPKRYSNLVRLLLWICGIGLILSYAASRLRLEHKPAAISYKAPDGEIYEIVGDDSLPDYPSPVVVTDKRGRAKWTVSIPPHLEFPLPPETYADICTKSVELADHVADMKSHGVAHHHAAHAGYYQKDKNFMDVAEAELHEMLPGVADENLQDQDLFNSMIGSKGDLMGMEKDKTEAMTVCDTSLTYVMETSDAGMGKTLMGLWMAPYGKFTTYFARPPIPSCLPPPRTQILPCPHQAKHLLVSAATTTWTFGHSFNEEYEDPKGMEVARQKNIFSLLRTGYEALFHLIPEDEAYVRHQTSLVATQTLSPKNPKHAGMVVGIHVRRGDRHPLEFQYQKSYIPLDRYASAAKLLQASTYNNTPSIQATMSPRDFEKSSVTLLASDDPDVYSADELSGAKRAQDRIELASKTALEAAAAASAGTGPDTPKKYIDETIGWEGGFFKDIFWSLGSTATSRTDSHVDDIRNPSDQALRLRELVGRAYLLDLKVLGTGTDAVVCGVSAMGCDLLAVMMGWEKAV
ncbi:MAG: hypothetical protein M4579_007381, partial [Chaenotheca gracillima]